MCLLVFMPEGITASKQSLENGAYYNDDGFGWAIRTPDKILVGKDMDFAKAYDEFMAARSSYNGDALFHMRITTHGATSLDNCHPFYVGKDSLSVVAHNGMLPVEPAKGDKRSDTRIFAETLLPKRGGISFLNGDESVSKLSKWAAGSKLAFLSVNPASKWRYVLINSEDGVWVEDGDDKGVWFSNNSYKYAKVTYTAPLWTGGWDYNRTPYKYYDYSTTQEGTSLPVVTTTTRSSLVESLHYELQHHAYEIAESLMEMTYQKNPSALEDPTLSENTYYDVAEDLLERFTKIYKPYDDDTMVASCSRCGTDTYLDHLDLPATHCSTCDACLYCGADLDDSGDCCSWPAGFMMSYTPQMTSLIQEGVEIEQPKVSSFF
jgi:predicted glutamine amidotransferase